MIKKLVFISIISLIAVMLLFGTKVINIEHMEATDDDASSYSDISAYIYVVAGVMICFVAFWTYKIHIVAGIIPFGMGFGAVFYGLYILYAKGILCVS